MKLQFEKELWALSPELAVMDTILNQHPEIYEMVKKDIMIGEKAAVSAGGIEVVLVR